MIPIPYEERVTLKRAPWACLGLLIAYLLVLLLVQIPGRHQEQQIMNWYRQSGLMKMEWPGYLSWLRINGHIHKAARLQKDWKAGDRLTVFRATAFDPGFEKDNLKNGTEYWSPARFYQWKQLRAELHKRAASLPQRKLGLIPDAPRPSTYLTWHFLQSDWIEWLVAVLFFAVFAWSVEGALRWQRLLVVYMLSGVVAGLIYVMFMSSSYQPLIGSTPLISALIGMYLGLFTLKPMKFLYFRGKRFDSFTAPAAVMASLWVLLPVFTWLHGSDAPLVWVAQVAGLLAGAGLVQLARDTDVASEDDAPEEEEDDAARQLRTRLGSAWASMEVLEFVEAEYQFRQVLEIKADQFDALTGLYHIRKLKPDTDEYRDTASRVLAVHSDQEGVFRQQNTLFRDYLKRAGDDAGLPIETRLNLVIRFMKVDEYRDAQAIMDRIRERGESHLMLAKTARALAQGLTQVGNKGKAAEYEAMAQGLD